MRSFSTLSLAAIVLVTGCSDPVPDIGPGPFRGALLVPESESLPVNPEDLTEDIEVASAKVPADLLEPETDEVPVAPEDAGTSEDQESPEATLPPEDTNSASTEPAEQEAEQVAEQASEEKDTATEDEEVVLLNFDDLADFEYSPPTLDEIDSGAERPEQVPEDVLAYDGKVVEIEGYMIPIEVEKGKVQSFILSRTLSGCCFGDMPNIQEWVDVKMMEDHDADYVPYAPVLVIGKISVGEQVDEYGITSLYRMTAESVEDPW